MEPWVEKYKPTSLDDVIADSKTLKKFNEYVISKEIPNLLFCGKPGAGKTTCAKILAKSIADINDILYICASHEKGVDVIRNKVDDFCQMNSFGGLRIIILDEFDGMTVQAMETMRNTMETYISNCRFILTANNEHKIIDPIKSRSQQFDFKLEDQHKKHVLKRCADILKSENVIVNDKNELLSLLKKYYPDIRRTINALQKNSINGVFNYNNDLDNIDVALLSYIKQVDIKSIRQVIVGNYDYEYLYKIIFNNAGTICEQKKLNIMLHVGEAVRWHSIVTDKEINFVTCIINVCKEICAND